MAAAPSNSSSGQSDIDGERLWLAPSNTCAVLPAAAVPIDLGDAVAHYVAMAASTRLLSSNLENWRQ
jgi:hypothetical protein